MYECPVLMYERIGSAGITAGSTAAGMMAAAGGATPSWGLVAGLQSVGAVGMSTSTTAGMAVLGSAGAVGMLSVGVVAGGVAYGVKYYYARQRVAGLNEGGGGDGKNGGEGGNGGCGDPVLEDGGEDGGPVEERIIEYERKRPFMGYTAGYLLRDEPNFERGFGSSPVYHPISRPFSGSELGPEWSILRGILLTIFGF